MVCIALPLSAVGSACSTWSTSRVRISPCRRPCSRLPRAPVVDHRARLCQGAQGQSPSFADATVSSTWVVTAAAYQRVMAWADTRAC